MIAGGFYLLGLGAVGLYEPAEGRYAEIARTMVTTGDWVIPHLNGLRYFEKPPLLYWTTAVSFQLFGLNEFAARLPTALAALLGIAATVALGVTLGGRATGVRAGVILATSLGYFVFARVVRPDMWLIAALTWGLFFLVRGYVGRGHPRTWSLGLGMALGIAVLAKGAIGLIIPLGVLGLFRILSKEWGELRRFSPGWGIGVLLAVVLPWHVWVAIRDPHFFRFYVVNEHLLRFVNHRVHTDTTPLPIALFWLVSGVWAFPWVTLLPVAWDERRLWTPWRHSDRGGRAGNLVTLWALVILGFFTANASRAEYYALPALPALAVLLGRFWADVATKRILLTSRARWLPGIVYLGVGIIGLLVFWNVVLPGRVRAVAWGDVIQRVFLSVPFPTTLGLPTQGVNEFGIWQALTAALGILLISGIVAAGSMYLRRSCMFTLAVSTLLLFPFAQQGFQAFEPVWSSKPLAQQLAPHLTPDTPILLDGPFENASSLSFYLQRSEPTYLYQGVTGDLAFGMTYAEARPLFLNQPEELTRWAAQRRSFCLITDSEAGWGRFENILPTSTATLVATSGRKAAWFVTHP